MSFPHASCLRPAAAALGFVAAFALIAPGDARAQSGTFGTDQRYCDNSALGQILSTSKGNIVGSAAGGAAGGLIGSNIGKSSGKTAATVLGVIGGALAGGYIGRSMDQTDQGCIGQSLEHAPANQPVAWQNPNSGSSYWVTPTEDRPGPNGETCRNYVADAVIGGQKRRTEYTACRQPDGSWLPVSSKDLRAARAPQADAPLSSDLVLKVQQRLREQGFYVRDNIDGVWGPKTSSAVAVFQRSKGLNATGQLDLATLTALDLPAESGVPQQGSSAQPSGPRN